MSKTKKVINITLLPNLNELAGVINLCIRVLAVMVSYYFNASIGWAILHYILGPIYLLYCLLLGRFAEGQFMEILNQYF